MHGFPHRTDFDACLVEGHTHGLYIVVGLTVCNGCRRCMSDTCRTAHSTGHDGLIGLFLPLHTQRRIERDGAEPVVGVVITVSGLGMHCDARDTGQQLLVELLHMLMMGDMVISHRHLTAPDTCAYITHTVVVTDLLMLIIRVALTVLGSIHHHLAPRIVIRGDQRTATRGGNHLIAVER